MYVIFLFSNAEREEDTQKKMSIKAKTREKLEEKKSPSLRSRAGDIILLYFFPPFFFVKLIFPQQLILFPV